MGFGVTTKTANQGKVFCGELYLNIQQDELIYYNKLPSASQTRFKPYEILFGVRLHDLIREHFVLLPDSNNSWIAFFIFKDFVSILGAAIGAMYIPEKWFPGAVDLYFNSHNLMHILVVAAVYSMHIATVMDLAWMSRVQCNKLWRHLSSKFTLNITLGQQYSL